MLNALLVNKADGSRGTWPQIGRDPDQREPGRTDYLGQWQADHAPVPGNLCRSSLLRSLWPDDRISAYERHRSTGKPRALGGRA